MSVPESSTSRPRTLIKEGSIYLTNYARNVNSYPTKIEKLAILDAVRAIPGNENFTLEKLNQWFTRHRNPIHPRPSNFPRSTVPYPTLATDLPAAVLLDDETILFPKLTPTHLQQLRVLYKKRSAPTEGIITFWAERLNADRAEVEAWIQYQQEKAKEDEHTSATPDSPDIPLRQVASDRAGSSSESPTVPNFPRPHLPTPAESLSPCTSPLARMPSLPPIVVKEEDGRTSLSPLVTFGKPSLLQRKPIVYTEHRSLLEGVPPLTRLVQDLSVSRQQTKPLPVGAQVPISALHVGEHAPRLFSRMETTTSLAASIRDSLRSDNRVDEPPPRTADEFAIKFQKIEDQINTFMKMYEDGKLAPFGWDSSLNNAMLSEL